jgi:signal transduction histidine kinase
MVWTDRRLRALACAVTATALLLTAAAVGLHLTWDGRLGGLRPLHPGDAVLATLYPLAGLLVLWHRPRNAAGWVLLSAAVVSVSLVAHQWYEIALRAPGSLPWMPLAIWLSAWTFVPYWAQPSLLPVLFPDGRLASDRWRWYLRSTLGLLAVLVLVAMFKVDEDVESLGGTNPLGAYWLFERLPALTGPVLQYGSGLLLWLVCSPIAVVGMLRRTRRARGVERTQLQWLVLGLTGCVLLTAADAAAGAGSELLFAAGFAVVPLTVAVAVLRHGLFDVEVVVHRTVAYGLLTGGGLLAYAALVAVAGRYVSSDGAGPLVAACVVAAAAAARTRLQSLVERRLFGSRRDPYAVVQQVGASTAAAQAPGPALEALVDSVRSALRLPFVQVLDEQGVVAAQAGAPLAGTHVIPVVDSGRQVGVLVVGRRSRKERLHAEEASALVDVARRAGALLTALRLQQNLQRSYAEALEVREQERQRLRRDLHDGVGPALVGVALQLEGLTDRLRDDPDLAARAGRTRDRLLTAVGDVRRLVDGLRPAEVEQRGLEAALRGLATEDGDPVRVEVQVDLPAVLPGPVEVAAYRIAGEAVANALRHAAARRVSVAVRQVEGAVRIEVLDDGAGLPVPVQPGVGLRSMQERAQELGGRLDVGPCSGGGTRVLAVLPA